MFPFDDVIMAQSWHMLPDVLCSVPILVLSHKLINTPIKLWDIITLLYQNISVFEVDVWIRAHKSWDMMINKPCLPTQSSFVLFLLQNEVEYGYMASCVVLFSIMLTVIVSSFSESKRNVSGIENQLIQHLLTNYSRFGRPISDISRPVVVTISFYLTQLMALVSK